MARLVLGKSPEELRAEEAEKQRELEAQVQQATLERQAKIEAMHKKQKTTKMAIIAISSFIAAALLFFGTYNTFFKKQLTLDDVRPEIYGVVNTINFPAEGLDNYLRENCEALFNKYITIDNKNSFIKSVDVDKDSCYVKRVVKMNTTLAQVYFAVDVVVSENDVEVTDPEIIRQLKKAGLTGKAQEEEIVTEPITEPITEPVTEPEVTDEPSDEELTTETTTENTSEIDIMDDEPNEPLTPDVANKTDESSGYTEIDSNIGSDNIEHYYIATNGRIMKTGAVTRQRYTFHIPIELYYKRSSTGAVVAAGFKPAAEMTLYTLEMIDINGEDDQFGEIIPNSYFICDEDMKLDQDTTNKIRIKVDKTLSDLYEGKDTSQDFLNYLQFNGYNAKYNGIQSIDAYNQTNVLGYNTHVVYTITTSQGFEYTLDTWLNVEASGNSYVIKGML